MKNVILILLLFICICNIAESQIPNLEVEGDYQEHLRIVPSVGHIDITASSNPQGLDIIDTSGSRLLSIISVDQGNNSSIGRLGLGTNQPQSMLSIKGPDDHIQGPNILLTGKTSDQVESGRIRFVEGTATNNYRGGYIHYDGSANRLHMGVHTMNGSNLADEINAISIHRSNGFVGLGTPNPAAQLHSFDGSLTTGQRKILGLFESTSNKRPTLFLSKSGTTTGYGIEYDGTVGSNLNKLKIFWKDASQERAIITVNNGTNAGRVGINTNTPVTDLEVTSSNDPTIRITSSSIASGRPQLQFDDYDSSIDWAISTDLAEGALAFSKGNANGSLIEILRINDNRIIPLTTAAIDLGSSSKRFKTVYLTQAPNVSSDKRLKNNIESISRGLNEVLKLRPVRYQIKNGSDQKILGLIAQEVLQVIPEVVETSKGKDDYYALRYTELIPVLIKAIQDQQELISSFKETIQALAADVEKLKM